jgi:hypothetical protein
MMMTNSRTLRRNELPRFLVAADEDSTFEEFSGVSRAGMATNYSLSYK